MSLLWVLRLSILGVLFLYNIFYRFLLKHREKYAKYLENLVLNLILVIFYNVVNYLAVILPSDTTVIPNSLISMNFIVIFWHDLVGSIIIILSVFFLLLILRKRKVLGAQDTGGKLYTSGSYGFCRHPIYFGITLISLGIALTSNNLDGLIVIPIIGFLNIMTGKIEQKYDMEIRFKEEYFEYEKRVRIFGPIWFWIVILLAILFPVIIVFIGGI